MRRVLPLLGILLFFSCGQSNKKLSTEEILSEAEVSSGELEIPQELVGEIFQQIPSPLEISVLLKELGIGYDKSFLNESSNVAKYNSNFDKALNLGIYGANLGYTNIYNQNQDALSYLNSIKQLADDLGIGQFFDFKVIKELATNSSNLDSLLLITTRNFNSINDHLQGQKRSNVSLLMLFGGWLEAMHLLTEVTIQNEGNRDLMERVADQRITLGSLKFLLEQYGAIDPNIKNLYDRTVKLEEAFADIEVVVVNAEPTYQEIDGELVVIDNSTSEIKITQENIQTIYTITNDIRNEIIN